MGSGQFSLTVLGSDGSYPGPGGACSGYLVTGGSTSLWIDAGSGTMSNLQRHISLLDIDAVVVTHAHPDHWTDLEGLAIALKWGIQTEGPPVYAPRGLPDLMRVGSAVDVFEWNEIDESTEVAIGDFRVSFSRTDHSVPTFAVRVDFARRSIGYSADTGADWCLSSLGTDLDLALCEASFLSDKEGSVQHLSARQAGASAAEAQARRLVVTHLMPTTDPALALDEAGSAFGSEVEIARIGSTFEI